MGAFTSFWAVHEFTPASATSYSAGALAMGVLVALLVGLDWDTLGAALKKEGRLHLETY
jgi:hypothetical protein